MLWLPKRETITTRLTPCESGCFFKRYINKKSYVRRLRHMDGKADVGACKIIFGFMKAKLVKESLNEFHKSEGDPLGSLGLGVDPLKKAHRILLFIGSKGEEGASLTEIQHYICVKLNKQSEHDFWEKDKYQGLRSSRGYYCTNLFGTFYGAYKGLLYNWCHKNEKGKWVLDRYPKPGEKLYAKKGIGK